MEKKTDLEPVALHAEQTRESTVIESEKAGIVRDYSGAIVVLNPIEQALVRKLDYRIMPTLWLMYWLNYLDRNAIALARLSSLEADLNLSETQYSTCVSILFVGYILGGIPSNMLITRVRPSWYMGGCMTLWAIVSTLTGVSQNFIGLLLTRFFLGITEAPYYPGALYLLSIFYTRREVATRIAILYTGNILATAFAGLIAIGIFKMDGVAGLAGWRWLFILQGIATFIVAVCGTHFLPDDPSVTRWLIPDERVLASERIRADTVDEKGKVSTWKGLREAMSDYRVWIFVFMQHMHLAANGFKNFFPSVVKSLGFSTEITLALTCPPYLIAGIVSIYWSWQSGKYNERTWHITSAKTVAIIGFVIGCVSMNTVSRYISMIVFSIGTYAVNSIILGWVGATCGQTKEKRAVAMSIIVSTSNASFIWTPYLWVDFTGDKSYVVALAASAGFSFLTAAAAWVMRFVLVRTNKKIRQEENEEVLFYAY
ncbi:MFS general substrate transporter [Hyaloscypha bicolor E]|uniref:MFS general substrate transporter n=1 Tax=Hyaloscypha bicolor E TaxID=1095630 RepID=A0A2J6SPR0_9HELO|nr:MFS general substrate transporter [Hyaloscypha bicolor E]PMD52733.1 MFS general substrate transporter [Hyaloscypha bicolor E]